MLIENAYEYKIAAVVVTYNRLLLLQECITSLRNQTRKLDEIIVVNNSSTDGTFDWLNEQRDLTVITQENSGSAGGQYTGIKTAYSTECDWIWCMDDDLILLENCIENVLIFLQNHQGLKIAAIQPLKRIDNYAVFHGAEFINLDKMKINNIADTSIEMGFVETNSFCFEGVLLNKKVVESIGLPRQEFFITNDDREYALRLKSQFPDFSIILMGEILMKRLRHTGMTASHYNFISKCRLVTDWDIYVMEQYFKNFFIAVKLHYPLKYTYMKAYVFILVHYRWVFKIFVSIIFFKKNKFQRLSHIFKNVILYGVYS